MSRTRLRWCRSQRDGAPAGQHDRPADGRRGHEQDDVGCRGAPEAVDERGADERRQPAREQRPGSPARRPPDRPQGERPRPTEAEDQQRAAVVDPVDDQRPLGERRDREDTEAPGEQPTGGAVPPHQAGPGGEHQPRDHDEEERYLGCELEQGCVGRHRAMGSGPPGCTHRHRTAPS